jgi:signal transduction histidine kinase/ActR/RegA family two-component response regulator
VRVPKRAPDEASTVWLRANTLGAILAVLGGLCGILFMAGVLIVLDDAGHISRHIALSIQTVGLLLLVFWLVSAVGIMLVVHRTILLPVARLRTAVAEVGKQRDLSKRIEPSLPGEVGKLATAINAMLLELQQTVEAESVAVRQADEELKRAKERAEHANRAKSQFLATISHEIRNQLNGLFAIVQQVRQDTLTPETRGQFAMAQASAVSLLALVNDLLDFAKIEAGKLELENINFDLVTALKEALKPLELRAGQKGLEFQVTYAADLPKVLLGDPRRLSQIVLNLVNNAIKFTERGTIRVSVEAAERRDQYVNVLIRVSDTGIGIPHDKLGQIFDPFAQAEGSTTRRFGGSGMGLTISRQLAELLGGSIGVESQLGQGSTFSFVARFVVPKVKIDVAAVRPLQPKKSMHVLVVEDNVINQELAVQLLRKRGHTTQVASSGMEALQLYQPGAFDLILMDVQMPEMDGLQVTRAIREREGSGEKRVPILAMTAHVFQEDQRRCQNAGMDGFLAKPIQAADFFAAIEAIASGVATAGSLFTSFSRSPHSRM